MLQVFLVLLTAVTFVLMAADPRPTDSTEAKSAWQVETTEVAKNTEMLASQKHESQNKETGQA